MPALSGIVQNIYIKSLSEPDRFGNLHRCGFKIGEDLVSWGTTKKPEISYKEGENYKQLQNGMEVEFMYKQNGDFKNISKTTLSVISTEGAQAAAPPSAPAVSGGLRQDGPISKPQAKGNFVNPAEVGQCLNLAVDVLGLNQEELLDPQQVTEAIKWYKEVRELFTELYPSVVAGKSLVDNEPKAKKAVEQPPMVLTDDDEI
jgi:hypothetical protein